MKTVGLIDIGFGNIGSIKGVLEQLGCTVDLINVDSREDLEELSNRKLILPGVGSFKEAALRIRSENWDTWLKDKWLAKGRPLLGICLGMQLLFENGDEGCCMGDSIDGLGLLKGRVRKMQQEACIRVPHIGWNEVRGTKVESRLMRGVESLDFYFVHSYMAIDCSACEVKGVAEYGGMDIPAVVESKNVFGIQFHPEKSQTAGKRLLNNFIDEDQ